MIIQEIVKMSYILRASLKYSIKQLHIKFLISSNKRLLCKSLSCFNYTFHKYYSNIMTGNDEKLELYIKKFNEDMKLARVNPKIVKSIVEKVTSSDSVTPQQALTLILCYGDSMIKELPQERTQLVQELWGKLENFGINLGIDHYNALLAVYLQNEHPFSPVDILTELNVKKLEPNVITYERLISRYCQIGDIKGATSILELIRDKDMPITKEILNDLIRGHSQANDMESAENIIDIMKKAHIKPNSETYKNLICGYIKQGRLEKIDQIILICRMNHIYIFCGSAFDIIYHLATYGYEDKIDEALQRIKRVPDYKKKALKCVNKLINIGKYDSAFKVSISIPADIYNDGTTSWSGNFFIHYIIRCNLPVEQVLKYCEELMNKNLNPKALSTAVNSCTLFNDEGKTRMLLRTAKAKNIPLKNDYFWPLLMTKGVNNDIPGLFEILDTMKDEFELVINAHTVRDYVVPFLVKQETNIKLLVEDLKRYEISSSDTISAAVIHWLRNDDIERAADMATHTILYRENIIQQLLVSSYLQTGNLKSFIKLLRRINDDVSSKINVAKDLDNAEEEWEVSDYREYIGEIILEVVTASKNSPNVVKDIELLLLELYKNGFTIDCKNMACIQFTMRPYLTPEMSILLEKLSDSKISAVTTN